MASLFGATVAGTPQFDRIEVAEETSPLVGAISEHIKSGKVHMAMPVIQSAPAAERSGSAETVAYGHNPEPAKQLSGLLDETADLGRNFLAKERARRSRFPAVISQSSSRPQTSRSTRRAMDQLGLEVGADMAAKLKADAAKSIVKGTKREPDRRRDAPRSRLHRVNL